MTLVESAAEGPLDVDATTAPAVIVIAKRPVAGRVKTRLCPPLSPRQAAEIASSALADTLAVVDAVAARQRLLYFGGDVSGWLPDGWRHRPQRGDGLAMRLADAFCHVDGPAVLIGMDTPQLTRAQLTRFDPSRFDACLGPTADGGYWAIGFRDARHAALAIPGVPMSRAETYAEQWARLRALDLSVQVLDLLIDVDTIESARAAAAIAPHTTFAITLSTILAGSA